jgi:manganese/zinc/iron transport system substrate-binding protein
MNNKASSRRFGSSWAIVITLSSILFLGCEKESHKREGRLLVVTTTGLIADAVKNIAGNTVDVIALMGPGVDPHLYKATHGDVRKITQADILLYNGLHLEGKMITVFEKTRSSKTVVAVAVDIPESELISLDESGRLFDPHIWFDVSLWKQAVKTIKTALKEKDPVHAELFERNTERYLYTLDSLHRWVGESVERIPESQRVLITAHDAFGYFGQAYGIEVRGLQGISTLSEFGLRDVTTLVDYIIDRKIKAVFLETSVSEKSIQAIVHGCNQKDWPVRIGGQLYSDALGDERSGAHTYTGMVRANVNTIVNSLK